jgi:hypothetical protein
VWRYPKQMTWPSAVATTTFALVQEIILAPLAGEDVSRLIADSLHCEQERAASLAQLVLEKTDGNPFFVIQFLSALAEEGLLTFDQLTRVGCQASRASWANERGRTPNSFSPSRGPTDSGSAIRKRSTSLQGRSRSPPASGRMR